MELIKIYKCLCDKTRLRILNILLHSPMTVSHLESIMKIPQSSLSKHLIYMKNQGMITSRRHRNWTIYAIAEQGGSELEKNLRCLQDCLQEYEIFTEDLKSLKDIASSVSAILEEAVPSTIKKQKPGSHNGTLETHSCGCDCHSGHGGCC